MRLVFLSMCLSALLVTPTPCFECTTQSDCEGPCSVSNEPKLCAWQHQVCTAVSSAIKKGACDETSCHDGESQCARCSHENLPKRVKHCKWNQVDHGNSFACQNSQSERESSSDTEIPATGGADAPPDILPVAGYVFLAAGVLVVVGVGAVFLRRRYALKRDEFHMLDSAI